MQKKVNKNYFSEVGVPRLIAVIGPPLALMKRFYIFTSIYFLPTATKQTVKKPTIVLYINDQVRANI